MRRLLCFTLLYLLIAAPSFGAGHFRDMAQDTKGNAMGNVLVTVYEAGTTNISMLFTDVDGSNAKENPFLTGADGSIDFYIDNGTYDVVLSCEVCYGGRSYSFDPSRNLNITVLDSTGIAAGSQGLGPNFNVTGGNIITGADETKKLTLFGSGGQSTSGWQWWMDSSGFPMMRCVMSNVVGDCNSDVLLNANKHWRIKSSIGTFVVDFNSGTGTFDTFPLNCTLAGVTCTLTDERHYSVATCQNTTPNANFDLPSSNAPTATCDAAATNSKRGYLAFNDSTDQGFHDRWILPIGFNSVNVTFRWKAAATSGSVVWCARLVRVPDSTTSDQAFPAQSASNCVQDTAKGTTLQENVATITGVNCSSCAAGDAVNVLVERDANGTAGTDSMTGDALLLNYGRAFVVTQ